MIDALIKWLTEPRVKQLGYVPDSEHYGMAQFDIDHGIARHTNLWDGKL